MSVVTKDGLVHEADHRSSRKLAAVDVDSETKPCTCSDEAQGQSVMLPDAEEEAGECSLSPMAISNPDRMEVSTAEGTGDLTGDSNQSEGTNGDVHDFDLDHMNLSALLSISDTLDEEEFACSLQDQVQIGAVCASESEGRVTPEQLATNRNIDLDTARRTIEVTAQRLSLIHI